MLILVCQRSAFGQKTLQKQTILNIGQGLLSGNMFSAALFMVMCVLVRRETGPLLVPIFRTLSRIRDIWGNCPYFVPILDFLLKSKGYLLPCEKIGTVLLLKEISKICPYFVQILAVFCLSEQEICPDFWPFFGLSIWRIWNISTNLL